MNDDNKNSEYARHYPINNVPCRKDETHNKYMGHYTGRCGKCGSSNLWDDNLSYGCRDCGRMWIGG